MSSSYDFSGDGTAVVDVSYQQTPQRQLSAGDLTVSMDSTDSNASLSFDSSPVTPCSHHGLSRDHTMWDFSDSLSSSLSHPSTASAPRYKQDIPLLAPRGGRFVPNIYSLQDGLTGFSSPTLPGADMDECFTGSIVSPQAIDIWRDGSYFPFTTGSSFHKYNIPHQNMTDLSQHLAAQDLPMMADLQVPSPVSLWSAKSGVSLSMISPVEQIQPDSNSPRVEFKPGDDLLDNASPIQSQQKHPLVMQSFETAKRQKVSRRQMKRQHRAHTEEGRVAHASKGKFTCTEADCGKSFQRQEHYQRHAKSHQDASPFRCALTEFLGPQSCDRRCKRADNRDQHHHTHGKGGLCDSGPGGRNVLVEAEVLIQALKKTSFCDDQDCNREGPCTNPGHLELMDSKRQSRIDAQMARYVKNELETPNRRRKTKGIASVHVSHDQMKKLGFPECLNELQECRVKPEKRLTDRLPSDHQYFNYEKWNSDESGQLQNWRIDHNGCILVHDIEDDGRIVERSLCGPLHSSGRRAASKKQG